MMTRRLMSGMHKLAWLASTVLAICSAIAIVWAFDRSLPTEYVGVKRSRMVGPDTVLLVQEVKRHRACDTAVTLRYIESPIGGRLYIQNVEFSAADMQRLEEEQPGEVRLLLNIPPVRVPGIWRYHVVLEFACNPIHKIWPIRTSYDVPFNVGGGGY